MLSRRAHRSRRPDVSSCGPALWPSVVPGTAGVESAARESAPCAGSPGLLQWGHGGESFQGQDGPGAQSRGGAENSVPRPRAAPHCTCAGVNRSTGPHALGRVKRIQRESWGRRATRWLRPRQHPLAAWSQSLDRQTPSPWL